MNASIISSEANRMLNLVQEHPESLQTKVELLYPMVTIQVLDMETEKTVLYYKQSEDFSLLRFDDGEGCYSLKYDQGRLSSMIPGQEVELEEFLNHYHLLLDSYRDKKSPIQG